jgi:zinc transport system substrate-binding protein
MQKRRLFGLALLIAVFVAIIGFAMSQRVSEDNTNKLKVTASFYPLYELAARIGGDKVSVTNITPAGAEPHDYEPSPQALVAAQNSDVFIYNGNTFEPWVDNFIPDYQHIAVKGSEGIELLSSEEGNDPHYWLDPTLAAKTVATIRDAFSRADPTHKDYYTTQAAAYTAQLEQLNGEISSELQNCTLRTVVTSHQAFGYFARRYNLTVVPIAGLSPDEEPSAAKLADISQLVRSQHIRYIFFESLVSPALAATIAQETGAQTAVFDPIEGLSDEAQEQGKNYISVQRDNLAALRTALACQ